MVEGGVEIAALGTGAAFHLNLAESLFPTLVSGGTDGIETGTVAGGKVFASPLAVHSRYGDVDFDLLTFVWQDDKGFLASIEKF